MTNETQPNGLTASQVHLMYYQNYIYGHMVLTVVKLAKSQQNTSSKTRHAIYIYIYIYIYILLRGISGNMASYCTSV